MISATPITIRNILDMDISPLLHVGVVVLIIYGVIFMVGFISISIFIIRTWLAIRNGFKTQNCGRW